MTGDEIKSLRDRYGLTQTDLAKALGTVKNRVSEWENGKKMATITEKALEYYFEVQRLKAKL